MYEMILREGEELLYSGSSLKGYVEELKTENYLEEEGGFSSRNIMVSILYPARDLEENPVELKRNTSITRAGKNYIIDEISIETDLYGEYCELTCYEEVKEETPKDLNPQTIEDKLELMAEMVFKAQCPYSYVSKFKTRTQEEYEALSYPRVMYDFWLGENFESVTRSRPTLFDDGKFYEVDTYDREVHFTFEFYADANARASIIDFEDFISNTRELGLQMMAFFEEDADIISIAPRGHTSTPTDNSSFRNNQPRRRKLINLSIGVIYIRKKEVTDFINGVQVTKESEINNAKDIEVKN